MSRMSSNPPMRVKCPAHPPRCKPGLALAGTGLSRSPGCVCVALMNRGVVAPTRLRLCSFDEPQFNVSTRDQVYHELPVVVCPVNVNTTDATTRVLCVG